MNIWLIDIDGTICEDIPNEESHRYPDATPCEIAMKRLWQLSDAGDTIVYFTSREEKDRAVTEAWLKQSGFPFNGLVMNKPRIQDGQTYHWVDNKTVRATHLLSTESWDTLGQDRDAP